MKTAFITGGTKGIGKSVVERLLEEGWNVIITYLSDEEAAKKILYNLQIIYPQLKIDVLRVDCGNLNSIVIIENYLKRNNIYLDAILFNTGATDRSVFSEISVENWQHVFDVNVNFPTFLLQRLMSRLKNNSSITFTGSLMGVHPHSLSLSYGVTKAAVHALVKNLVKVLSDRKIRVNAIAPGFVSTEWQNAKPKEQKISINKKIALERFCEPSELADAYLFLINNSYVNGEILVVDGGYAAS